ncbi:MAG: hypothetical protein Q9174_000220 [Haloplaca sp. 1 TL-2023]
MEVCEHEDKGLIVSVEFIARKDNGMVVETKEYHRIPSSWSRSSIAPKYQVSISRGSSVSLPLLSQRITHSQLLSLVAKMSSPTNFAISYSCGHRRTFQIKEIFAESYDLDIEARDGANKVNSPSPSHEVDLDTARTSHELSKVSWQVDEASSPESPPSSSSSLQLMDPLYFYPKSKVSDMRVFERWEDCPTCKDEANADDSIVEMGVAHIPMSGTTRGESDAGSDEALSSVSSEIGMETHESDGYWDVFRIGDYSDEGDRDDGLISSLSNLDVSTEEQAEFGTDSEQDIADEGVEVVGLV